MTIFLAWLSLSAVRFRHCFIFVLKYLVRFDIILPLINYRYMYHFGRAASRSTNRLYFFITKHFAR